MIQVKEVYLDHFLTALRDKTPLAFSRWGDGEWFSALGLQPPQKSNTDGHHYFPAMGEVLRGVLKDRPSYLLGMQPSARRQTPTEIDQFLANERLEDLSWINADVFHNAAMGGGMSVMASWLNERPVVLVGPTHLRQLKIFKPVAFVEVPRKDCFLQVKQIIAETTRTLQRINEPYTVVAFSAGMPANIMIHELHRSFADKTALIDFGSVWDPWCGVLSRQYMKKGCHEAHRISKSAGK